MSICSQAITTGQKAVPSKHMEGRLFQRPRTAKTGILLHVFWVSLSRFVFYLTISIKLFE